MYKFLTYGLCPQLYDTTPSRFRSVCMRDEPFVTVSETDYVIGFGIGYDEYRDKGRDCQARLRRDWTQPLLPFAEAGPMQPVQQGALDDGRRGPEIERGSWRRGNGDRDVEWLNRM